MLANLEAQVNPKHTIVIVIDVQNDFCAHGGVFHKRGYNITLVQKMIPTLRGFIEEARRVGVKIAWVKMLNMEWTTSPSWQFRLYRDGRLMTPPCVPDSWGQEYYEISPVSGEIEVVKPRYSAFIGTNLDLVLRSLEIKTLIMTGVATNLCVESTARDGYMMDYYVVFLDDCTASFTTQADHEATLKNIANFFGIVTTSAEVVRAWETLSKGRC